MLQTTSVPQRAESKHASDRVVGAQVKGFALAAGKTVPDGGVGKMLEMARANVRNIPRPTIAR